MLKKTSWILVGLSILFFIGLQVTRSMSNSGTAVDAALWTPPDFSLTDADGTQVSRQDLLGKVWVANFIFTRCPGPCPKMTQRMLSLQRRIPAQEPLRLVSISIDPAYDTPEVLAEYADHWGADRSRWHFLTGPPGETIGLIVKGFYTAVDRSGADSEDVIDPESIAHGTHFILVDHKGGVRGVYDFNDEGMEERILADIRLRIEEARVDVSSP